MPRDDFNEQSARDALEGAEPPEALPGGDRIHAQVGEGARGVVIGKNIQQIGTLIQVRGDYIQPRPAQIAPETLAAAEARLAGLPLDEVPPVAPLPPGSRMPLSPNPLFVGRQADLKKLARALKGGETAAIGQIAAATGLGGIGKTQLAAEFAHRYGQFFGGGVFWLSFADPAAVRAELAACAVAGGGLDLPPGFGDLPLDDQVRLVLSAWGSPLPRLLIFDNCEEENLLDQWRPPTGGCRVLVTSRCAAWDPALGVQALPLGVLDRAESVALLRKFRPDLAETEADAIAAELGDLPLALHLAGSYLARYRHAVAARDYLEQVRRPNPLAHRSLRSPALGTAGGFSPTRQARHVAQTFAVSYGRLDPAQTTDALAVALLARAVCLAPGQPVPRDLLRATLGEEVGLEAAEDGLARLLELGLLGEEAGEGVLILHRLLAAFVREVAADGEAQAKVEETLYREANRLNQAGYPAPLLAWQAHLRAVTDAAQAREDEQAASLCNELGYHLKATGDLAGARPYLECALRIREQVLGPDHPDTAVSLNNLGALLYAEGDLAEARAYLERALRIREKALGPHHPDTAVSIWWIGTLLAQAGDLDGARVQLRRAVEVLAHTLGAEHPRTQSCRRALDALEG